MKKDDTILNTVQDLVFIRQQNQIIPVFSYGKDFIKIALF